jgi:hypothetical protein
MNMFFSKIHSGRCIGFIEEEAKMADKTPKRLPDTNAMPNGLQLNPHRQMKGLALYRL